MVCHDCQAENTILDNGRMQTVVSCRSCNGILFEIDDSEENYRITKNFRVYYKAFTDSLARIQSSYTKKSEEIRKALQADTAAEELTLWNNAISRSEVFSEDNIHAFESVIRFLDNENGISDIETRKSVADLLENARVLTAEMYAFRNDTSDHKNKLNSIKTKWRDVNMFTNMMDSYFGEISSFGRNFSA